VRFSYDIAGRRTQMAYRGGLTNDCDYLVTGAVTRIRENGATSGVGVLTTYAMTTSAAGQPFAGKKEKIVEIVQRAIGTFLGNRACPSNPAADVDKRILCDVFTDAAAARRTLSTASGKASRTGGSEGITQDSRGDATDFLPYCHAPDRPHVRGTQFGRSPGEILPGVLRQ